MGRGGRKYEKTGTSYRWSSGFGNFGMDGILLSVHQATEIGHRHFCGSWLSCCNDNCNKMDRTTMNSPSTSMRDAYWCIFIAQ